MGGRRLGILTPDGQVYVRPRPVVNPAPRPAQGAVNPLALRPAYAPGSPTRTASQGLVYGPAYAPPPPVLAVDPLTGGRVGGGLPMGMGPRPAQPMRGPAAQPQVNAYQPRPRQQPPLQPYPSPGPAPVPSADQGGFNPVSDIVDPVVGAATGVGGAVADTAVGFARGDPETYQEAGEAALEAGAAAGGAVLDWADKPREWVAGQAGAALYEIATGDGSPEEKWQNGGNILLAVVGAIGGATGTIDSTELFAWAMNPANRAAIEDAYENGYDVPITDTDGDGVLDAGDGVPNFTGERAVWELFVSTQPWYARAVLDTTTDPLNWTPAPAALGGRLAAASRALREVPEGADAARWLTRAISRTGEVAGQAAQAPYVVTDVIPEAVVRGAGRAVRRGVGFIDPYTGRPGRAGAPSPAGRLEQDMRRMTDAAYPFVNREARPGVGPQNLEGGVPPTVQPPPPTVAPDPTLSPVVDPATVAGPPRRAGYAPGSGRRAATVAPPPQTVAPPPQTVAPNPVEEVTPPVVDAARVVEPEAPVTPPQAAQAPTTPPRSEDAPATATVAQEPTPARSTEKPTWVILRDRGNPSGNRGIDILRRTDPEAEAEVWRRIGRERYDAYRGQIADRTIPQPDKDLISARFVAEQRRVIREVSPGTVLPEPELTVITPRPGRQLKPHDQAQLDLQRQVYRPWTDPETVQARNRLYTQRVISKHPPSEQTYRAIVDGTLTSRNPNATINNVRVADLPNMPADKRRQLANEWRTDEQDAFRRYQEARAVRAEIDPAETFGEAPASLPDAPASAVDVPASRAEAPASAVEAPRAPITGEQSRRMSAASTRASERTRGTLRPVAPEDVPAGIPVREGQRLYVNGDGDMAIQRGDQFAVYAAVRGEGDNVRMANLGTAPDIGAAQQMLTEQASPASVGRADTPIPEPPSNPFAAPEPPRGAVGIVGSTKAHAAFNAMADLFSRPTTRKNRGFARASDATTEYPVEGFVGPGAPRRAASDVEQEVFADPGLAFADGTSWWDFLRRRIDEQTTAGTEANEATATALAELAKKAAKDRGIGATELPTLLRAYDAYLNAYRELTMYNLFRAIDQPATQLLGNVTTAAVTGNVKAAANMVSPLELVGRLAKPGKKSRLVKPSGDRLVEGFGLGRQRAGVAISTFDPAEAGQRAMAVERFLEPRIGKWPGRGVAFIPANRWVRDWAFASDRFTRETLWSTNFRRLVPTALKDLRDEGYRLVADKANLPPAVVDEVYGRWRRLLRTGLPPETVYADMDAALRRAGVNDRTAAEMARSMEKRWANATERAADEAGREVTRIFFSGVERNVDRVLRRAALFHYFASRQAVLYASEALSSPRLLAAYGRAADGLERHAEEQGWPSYMTGFVKLWGTVGGFAISVNPVATLMTFATFREASGDDEGFLSRVVNSFFLSPLIKGAVEYLGFVEPTFLSDPTALRPLLQNAIRVLNVLRANDLIPGDTPIFANKIDEAEQWLREQLSTFASDLGIPGAEPIVAEQVGGSEQDKFNTRIWQLALAEGQRRGLRGPALYDWANERADQAYDDPDDPLFVQAFEDYSMGQGVEGAINLGGPVQARDRLPIRDERAAAIDVIRGEAEPSPGTQYPGTGTPVVPASEAETGSAEEALNQGTYDARGDAQSTPEGRALGGQHDEYNAIGTPEQQEAYQTYNQIANGLDDDPTVKGPNAGPQTVTIGGEAYTEEDLQRAEAAGADRYGIADAWAAENGVTDDVAYVRDTRSAYRDEHPEYDAFKEWQSAVYDAEGGPVGWFQAQPEGSAAGIYYREQVGRGLTGADLERALASPEAYLATQGVESSVYGPELPEPDQDPVPPASAAPGGSGGATGASGRGRGVAGGPPEDPATALEDDIRSYHAEVQAVSGILVAAGLPANALTSGNDMLEEAARNVLDAYGIDAPRPSSEAAGYLEWVRAQPRGADISIETYLVYAAEREAALAALMLPYQTAGGEIDPAFLAQYGQRPSVAEGPQGGYGTVNIGTRLSRPRFFGDDFDIRIGGSLGPRLSR